MTSKSINTRQMKLVIHVIETKITIKCDTANTKMKRGHLAVVCTAETHGEGSDPKCEERGRK
jgi:hypothetical protein